MKQLGLSILLALIMVLVFPGCTKTSWDRTWDYAPKTVTVFNTDGTVRRTYKTAGKVYSEQHSDGFFFTNAANGKLTMVSGWVEITQGTD